MKPPCAWYMWVGFWRVEVDDTPPPSPTLHEYANGHPAVVEPDEDPADDVVHGRPLDALQPLQRAPQGLAELGPVVG